MSKDYDQIARDRIRKDIDTNFFVEAGAGSGKTTVLVDRMVAMVEGGIDISRICAITFTIAAAGEFYARFQEQLAKSDSENARRALRDIDLCFMGTIDSFCNMVLSEHPAAAGIPSNAGITDKKEMEALYLREYSRILSGEAGDEALQKKAERFNDQFYNAKDIFIAGIKTLMETKAARFVFEAPSDKLPDELFRDGKAEILRILGALRENEWLLDVEGRGDEKKKAADALMNNFSVIEGSWNGKLGDVESALKTLRGLRIKIEADPNLLGPGWDRFFEKNKTSKWYQIIDDDSADPLLLKAIGDYRFALAADFINDCVDDISDTLRKEGKLSFTDYLIYLRDMLREDACGDGRLIRHIYDRHSYFLIDEFQDTNPVQAEIFFYLTAREPKPDWRDCVPQPGSLFIVGDPKQSIYRFRSADVPSFLRIRKLFENPEVGEVLGLTRNFRSTDGMCAWFNRAFTDLLPDDTEDQSRFSEIPTGEKDGYASALEGAYYYVTQYKKAVADRDDPLLVASIILKIIGHPDIPVNDFRDFMVITPTTSHLSYYMNAFAAAGIPFRVEGEVLFDECDALRSISYLMSAAADPFDKKAVFAAKHLSGCSISDDEIKEYAKKAKDMTPAAVFTMLSEEKRVFARVGTENAEYVYFALELLRSAETDGTVSSVKEGAAYIASLVNNESSDERCIQLRRDANRVHLANLHKVKGLEAPVVILADPDSSSHQPARRVEYSMDPPESFVFSLAGALSTTAYADKKQKEAVSLEAEKERLRYVAATRAVSILVISDGLDSKGKSREASPWYPLLEYVDKDVFDVIGDVSIPDPEEKPKFEAEALYDEAEAESVIGNSAPKEASYTIRKPSEIKLKGSTSSGDDHEDEDALLVGTMVHRIMEVLVSSGNKADLNDLVTETVREYDADEPRYRDLLHTVGETMRKGGYPQQNDAPQDMLGELLSADEVYCELPFCYNEGGGKIWHGVMDVVYRKGDRWHIVDYKTNADPADLDAHYLEQLETYKKAFREITGSDADAMIYHIDKA